MGQIIVLTAMYSRVLYLISNIIFEKKNHFSKVKKGTIKLVSIE